MLSRAVLETVANSPSSTDVERSEALAALRSMDGVGNEVEPSPNQDVELEMWLLPDKRRTASERITMRASFSPASRQLLDDLGDSLLIPTHCDWGAVIHRRKALLGRTGSEVVGRASQSALETAVFCLHEKEIMAHDTPDVRRAAHRAYLGAERLEQ